MERIAKAIAWGVPLFQPYAGSVAECLLGGGGGLMGVSQKVVPDPRGGSGLKDLLGWGNSLVGVLQEVVPRHDQRIVSHRILSATGAVGHLI